MLTEPEQGLDGEIILPGEEPRADDIEAQERARRLEAFIGALTAEAKRRRDARSGVEQRWLDDIRNFHGIYDPETEEKFVKSETSRVFVNMTAPKTEAYEARIFDLLFPTDERNWAIGPTPVPELTDQAKAAADDVLRAKQAADGHQMAMMEANKVGNAEMAAEQEKQMRVAEQAENAALARQEELQLQMREAQRRAKMMEDKIADHLAYCVYPVEARDAIADACRIGMGVLKGPVLGEKPKTRWSKGASGRYELQTYESEQPSTHRVDPWLFYPDPDVKKLSDSNGFYELHPMNRSQLRKLAKRKDVNKAVVRELLELEPDSADSPSFLSDLHSITGQNQGRINEKYMVWEYTGPIEAEELKLLAEAMWEKDPEQPDRDAWLDDIDPLMELSVRVLFCQGKALSFALHPLDSQRPMYKAFTIREDETSPFGYGIPWIMRHPQAIINGAFRMMMDNSGLGAGPQLLVNKEAVEPQDGNWTVKPRKVWFFKPSQVQGVKPLEAISIDTHQQELTGIIQLAAQVIDETTSMPQIAQGEQGAGVTKTAQGMALLLNSANVGFRRVVKNWDDNITTPLISDLYDWEMQFGKDEAIKGDYDVVARGASVLLVREMQAQNLMFIAATFGDHPVYGPRIKHDALLANLFRALMIDASEVTLTETEFKAKQAEMAQGQQPDPRIVVAEIERELKTQEFDLRDREMQAKVAIAEADRDAKLMLGRMTYEHLMTRLAEEMNMNLTELEAKLAEANAKVASSERLMAAEIAMQQETGKSAGGSV